MAKKSGISKSVAKKAYKNVKTDLANLEKYMNQLVEDVQKMNEQNWYGDKLANDWYTQMKTHYSDSKSASLVNFYTGVTNFQEELNKIFTKASANGIKFM